MGATHNRACAARRACCVFVLALAVSGASVASSTAAGASKATTPLTAYKSFAFEFEAVVSGDGGPSVSIATKGHYVRPQSQDCEATVSLGGFELTHHAVVIGRSTWLDDGDGLKKVKRGKFDFEDQCASSPAFWDDFPFDIPASVHGTSETRDGVDVEHVDLTEVIGAVGDLISDAPSDVTVERAGIWRDKHNGVVIGLDLALRGSSPDTCHELLELEGSDVAPQTCSMTVRLDLSRFNDRKLDVRAGRGSSKRVIRT
jgi:hypothetical protein